MLNIPNKFPEYLSFGNAIVCSTKGEMSDLVKNIILDLLMKVEIITIYIQIKEFIEKSRNLNRASSRASKLIKKNFYQLLIIQNIATLLNH